MTTDGPLTLLPPLDALDDKGVPGMSLRVDASLTLDLSDFGAFVSLAEALRQTPHVFRQLYGALQRAKKQLIDLHKEAIIETDLSLGPSARTLATAMAYVTGAIDRLLWISLPTL